MIHPSVKFWYRHLSNISEEADIGEGTVVHAGVHIHDEVSVGKNCQIEAASLLFNGVKLEDRVFIGPRVTFTNDHDMRGKREDWTPTPTLVKEGAHIGAGALILAGITIGRDAVIGMGSVVLKDVGDGETWVGNPARFLKSESIWESSTKASE